MKMRGRDKEGQEETLTANPCAKINFTADPALQNS